MTKGVSNLVLDWIDCAELFENDTSSVSYNFENVLLKVLYLCLNSNTEFILKRIYRSLSKL